MTPYHFTECGLPNVILNNGFTLEGEGEEETVAITNIDHLHRALGHTLTDSRQPRGLTGAEVTFLRTEMGVAPEELARLLGVTEREVTFWQSGNHTIEPSAERLFRLLYRENYGKVSPRTFLDALATFVTEASAHELAMPVQYICTHDDKFGWKCAITPL